MKLAGWAALALVVLSIPLVQRCMRSRAHVARTRGRMDSDLLYDIEDCPV